MFWFDNSRKSLVSYSRNLNPEEREHAEKIFTEIIGHEYGTKAPALRFNSSDAKVIDDYEIIYVKALYSDLCINNNKLTNIDQMQDVLTALVRKLKYFKFKDSDFYKSIKTACQELENYLVEKYLETMELDEQAEFSTNVSKQISAIYQLIDDKYKNG